MNVGIFTDDFYPIVGGQGRHIYELYKRLYSKKGFTVYSPNINNLKNHKTLFPATRKFGRNIGLSFMLNHKINQIIKQDQLDIVHFHCGPGGIIITKKPKAKMICTVHHTYYQQQKYIPGQKWKYLFYLFEKKMYLNADKIIAVSSDTKKVLEQHYGINPNKVTVISNGIDTSKFHPIKDIKKIPNSLLYVGRIDKRKGVDFLLKSMPLVVKIVPTAKLFVGGIGKDLKKLKVYVKKNKLDNNVTFIGYIPEEKLNEWYNKVCLVVVPSVFEGFGFTVVEALAAGTYVIGTNVDGIRTLVSDETCLVQYNLHSQLADKIVKQLIAKRTINFLKSKPYTLTSFVKKTRQVYYEI